MADESSPSFAISVQSDAYGGSATIMGRSVAGETFLRGIARTWPNAALQCVATGRFNRERLVEALRGDGFAGELHFSTLRGFSGAEGPDALYYPTIVTQSLARFRNRIAPTAYSLFGVTHTISTDRALDGLSAMAAAPFMPWDALICTSHAALSVVADIFDEAHAQLRRDLFVISAQCFVIADRLFIQRQRLRFTSAEVQQRRQTHANIRHQFWCHGESFIHLQSLQVHLFRTRIVTCFA